MTDTPPVAAQQSLGVGALIGDTFSILFGSITQLLVLAFVPALVITIFQYLLAPELYTEVAVPGSFPWVGFAVVMAIALIGTAIITALIVRMAYDVKTGHAVRIGDYFASAMAVAVPLILCSIGATIAIMIGFMLLIVPGFMLMVIWAVYTPAIVIERAGFGSFSRSAELTSGYRWPIFGALLLMFLIVIVIGAAFEIVTFFIPFIGAPGAIMKEAVSSGLTMAFSGIFYSLLYARLREIKEGMSVEELADVFA